MSLDQWLKDKKRHGVRQIDIETMEAKLKEAREEFNEETRKILNKAGDVQYETAYKNAAVMFNNIHNQIYGN